MVEQKLLFIISLKVLLCEKLVQQMEQKIVEHSIKKGE